MHNVRKVTDDLYWIGVDDRRLTLFENIHPIPEGISYNSYVLLDEKTVLIDTVELGCGKQFFENLSFVLQGRPLDYCIINHVEPDHASSIGELLLRYPDVTLVASEKAFTLMGQFGFTINPEKKIIVKEGDTQAFGKHTFTFVTAPMVHWPEVIVSFDTTSGVLFSADAFGTFGALNGRLFNDEVDFDRDWLEPARRYYTNIVGKYGAPVQMLLKKAAKLPIKMIAPLHGPVWRSNLAYFIDKYDKWSSYTPEEKGVLIVYGSMYGNTENAAEILAGKLVEKGITNVRMYDVSKTHVSYLISETFKYSHLVIASVTYNLGIYPPMLNYLHDMAALAVQKRTVAIVGNGSWAPMAAGKIAKLIGEMKNMTLLEARPAVTSSVTKTTDEQLEQLADGLVASVKG